MRPRDGELLHFSHDPTIAGFVPHVAASARARDRLVWAVDAVQAPAYWFPRDCPRALAWALPHSDPADVARIVGPGGGTRVHAIEYGWLERMRTAALWAYRLPATGFAPHGDSAHVATDPVDPLGPPERVGDLFALHARAGIQLRVLPTLPAFWSAVVTSTLGFSGIRLRNAAVWDPAVPR